MTPPPAVTATADTADTAGPASGERPAGDPRLDAELILAPSARTLMMRRIFGHRSLVIAAILLSLIVLMAVFAPLLAPYDPYTQSIIDRLIPPFWHDAGSWAHPFGTDGLGRDYLSRIIFGARISLLIGLMTALISGIIGCALGVVAGYFGGRVDMAISFIITTRLSMPILIVALAIVALVGGSLFAVIMVLGLLLWDRYAVVMRSATQQVVSLDYVQASLAIGCSKWRIIVSEILPNVLNNLIIVATFEVAHAILLEAALSFLGLGVQPPLPSWGLMIAEGKEHLLFDSWVIAIPGIALSILVLAVNLLGDGLRDITAPGGHGR